jgi:dTDP-4-dehydrorhamnose 3,5-epimerase-like enzyme
LDLEIVIVRQQTKKAVQVILSGKPARILWIPRAVIKGGYELQAGEMDIVLEVGGAFARQLEQDDWRREMRNA